MSGMETPRPDDRSDDQPMTLQEHLGELRARLIKALAGVGVGMIGGFFGAQAVQDHFYTVVKRVAPEAELVYSGPADAFTLTFKIATYLGVALAMPILVYQFVRFLAPGLTRLEKRWVYAMLPFISIFFALGVAFSSFVAIPNMFEFLLTFGDSRYKRYIPAESMFGFFSSLSLWTGVMFELPLVMFLLASLGVVSYRTLRGTRKYAAVGLMILAAVITSSPEAGSMLLVWAPMYLLFEFGLILARFARSRRRASTLTLLAGALALHLARHVRAQEGAGGRIAIG